ncbi:MAG: hypothetical protein ABFS46_12280 [Myxococcota bacterium]
MNERRIAFALIAAGILFNNYVFFHDVVFDKHDGMIFAGWWSVAGILVSWVVTGYGVHRLTRS